MLPSLPASLPNSKFQIPNSQVLSLLLLLLLFLTWKPGLGNAIADRDRGSHVSDEAVTHVLTVPSPRSSSFSISISLFVFGARTWKVQRFFGRLTRMKWGGARVWEPDMHYNGEAVF